MKDKKQYGISTQIEYVDIKEILKHYKKSKYWKKKWCVFKTNNFKFNFWLSSIDIVNNKIEGKVCYERAIITRGNRRFEFPEPYSFQARGITIPIDNPEYTQQVFEHSLITVIKWSIEDLEDFIITRTSDYKSAEASERLYYDRVEELAEKKLDEEGVSNDDIRDAYISACRSKASCDYTSPVIRAKQKTVFPNLYLMLYSWFNKPEQYEATKKEILEKQSKLKSILIGIKKEQWIMNDRIESEEINEEIIEEVLEEI